MTFPSVHFSFPGSRPKLGHRLFEVKTMETMQGHEAQVSCPCIKLYPHVALLISENIPNVSYNSVKEPIMLELSARQVNITDSFWSPRLLVNAQKAIFH